MFRQGQRPGAVDRGDKDERWPLALREQVRDLEVETSCELLRATMSLRQLTQLKAGDVIPVTLPRTLELCVEDVPLFRGSFGVANGRNAVRVQEVIRRASMPASLREAV